MSINSWPKHEGVTWSKSIPVVFPDSNGFWEVCLLLFKIVLATDPPPGPDGSRADTQLNEIPGTKYIFNGDTGIHVILDTGERVQHLDYPVNSDSRPLDRFEHFVVPS